MFSIDANLKHITNPSDVAIFMFSSNQLDVIWSFLLVDFSCWTINMQFYRSQLRSHFQCIHHALTFHNKFLDGHATFSAGAFRVVHKKCGTLFEHAKFNVIHTCPCLDNPSANSKAIPFQRTSGDWAPSSLASVNVPATWTLKITYSRTRTVH